ncbi:orotate phosphoribosyltransferase [Arenicella sp. 4NH20-0111]|uniref:orotate phosphoribosyltransferase n=1 Tax=Arenicella sp. 4NH20-0111 TaxID=3127648 RepID=UPI00310565ED
MLPYQEKFIEFALETGVLRFGEFTLKSGRTSPYFFNTGLFNSGGTMLQFSRFFAQSIINSDIGFDVLFGPAYKGITLACGAAMSISEATGDDVPFAFNRKEKKDHGEGGTMVGADLVGDIAIIDDVITAGTAIRESFEMISQAGATPKAVFLALDRQELGQKDGEPTEMSAIQQVEEEFGLPVVAIATMNDLIDYLKKQGDQEENLAKMMAYRSQYGIK